MPSRMLYRVCRLGRENGNAPLVIHMHPKIIQTIQAEDKFLETIDQNIFTRDFTTPA